MRKLLYIFLLFSFWGQAQICPGEQGKLNYRFWLDLEDSGISSLLSRNDFPYSPDSVKTLYRLETPYRYSNFYGGIVEGFIRDTSTRTVRFGVTGDNHVEFYLSTDDNPENASLISYVDNPSGYDNLMDDTTQISENITLQAGEYYYFKVLNYDSWGNDYGVVWWEDCLLYTSPSPRDS